MLALGNELGSVPYSYILWKSLRRTGVNSALKVWFSSLVKLSGPGLFFVRKFLITNSFPLPVISLLRLSVLSCI